ncbi:helix-turn-helix domain-containing protein [Pedobacter sp. MR2016-19]|uniref:helix-turn-helix domain-containing protein n=1 Tax=Pedobacter sp. MR2016-19 TaxID=2780089 RepID=UPI0018750310|nr:helix-turn-helix domain-containing protein [Pedobacter sp. MR2016-19]MBE5322224.1 helix-turn-helix domain-containing protein [Pedobacter sp. MR2016-19]
MFKNFSNQFNKAISLTRSELKNVYHGNIRKYRDEKCYTQSYMANQLGIGQSAYQKIESGDIKISMERLTEIANILGKPINVFIEGNEGKSEIVKIHHDVQTAEAEYDLMRKIILQQKKQIGELEAKVARRDEKIEELKKQLK